MERQDPYGCERCGRSFDSADELERHNERVHPSMEDESNADDVLMFLLQ